MSSLVLSIRRCGLSMTSLWRVLGGSEVSPLSYPLPGSSTPAGSGPAGGPSPAGVGTSPGSASTLPTESCTGGIQMAEGPARGLADVIAASTALSDIDGRAGRLSYRGHDINELAGRAGFAAI